MSSQPSGLRIEPLLPSDIPAAARLTGEAFALDRHTQLKTHGRAPPPDMEQYILASMPRHLRSPACYVLKAVDEATGALMGVCNWGVRGFTPPRHLPCFEGTTTTEPVREDHREDAEREDRDAKNEHQETEKEHKDAEKEQDAETKDADPIARLIALTDSSMNAFLASIPPTAPTLFVIGLAVAPRFQRRGAATALLRWGTTRLRASFPPNLYVWAQSSDPAWPAYRSCGFRVVRTLELDLDAYAPCPPSEGEGEGGGDGGRWGRYVFRYVTYDPPER